MPTLYVTPWGSFNSWPSFFSTAVGLVFCGGESDLGSLVGEVLDESVSGAFLSSVGLVVFTSDFSGAELDVSFLNG